MFYLLSFLQFVSDVSPSVLSYSCPGYVLVAVDTAKSDKGIVCILDCLSEDIDYSGFFTLGSLGFLPGLPGPWTYLDSLGPSWTPLDLWTCWTDLGFSLKLANLYCCLTCKHISIYLLTYYTKALLGLLLLPLLNVPRMLLARLNVINVSLVLLLPVVIHTLLHLCLQISLLL